jgi:hypothetical protein
MGVHPVEFVKWAEFGRAPCVSRAAIVAVSGASAVSCAGELVFWITGRVRFVDELETVVGNQFIPKHVCCFKHLSKHKSLQ